MKKLVLIVFIVLYDTVIWGQNIPKNPNQKDAQNRKQGKWTLLYNANYESVISEKDAFYYRIADFKDNKSVGKTQYFFVSNGKLHFEGEVLEETEKSVEKLKGFCVWYYENGNKMREIDFDDKGNIKTINQYDRNGKPYTQEVLDAINKFSEANQLYEQKKYQEALKLYEEAKQTLNIDILGEADYYYLISGIAICSKQLKIYGKAAKYFDEALPIVEKYYGKEHSEYGFILEQSADVALLTNNINKYDFYIEELKKFYEKTKGKNSKEYVAILNDAAFSYYYKQDFEKAAKIMEEIMPLQEKLIGKNSQEYAILVYNIACCYYELKNCNKAMPFLNEAKKIFENLNLQSSNNYKGAVQKIQNCK